jgi:hypothetical protein
MKPRLSCCVDHGLHAAHGAPQRHQDTGDDADAESAAAVRGDAARLLAQELKHVAGKDVLHEGEIVGDCRGVEEQAIGRDQGGDRGKDREQHEEGDAGGDREQPVRPHFPVGAPEDVLPAEPGNLQRVGGMAAALMLPRAAALDRRRLLGAARLPERRLPLAPPGPGRARGAVAPQFRLSRRHRIGP